MPRDPSHLLPMHGIAPLSSVSLFAASFANELSLPRFTILERKNLKSITATRSTPDNTDSAMLELDVLDNDLSDFADLRDPRFSGKFPFPTDDFEGHEYTDNMATFSFDNFLDDTSQPQNHNNCYQMDNEAPHRALSRRPSQISSLPTPDNSVSTSCPLARLGSRVPALTTSNTSQGTSNSNSCPTTPPFTPTRAMGAIGFSSNGGSPSSSICPSLTQTQPQAIGSSHTEATVAVQGQDFNWPDLQQHTQNAVAAAGDDTQGRGGFSTPSKSRRTTITLEDAEPGMILDVMKVLVSSKARVRFQTEWVGWCCWKLWHGIGSGNRHDKCGQVSPNFLISCHGSRANVEASVVSLMLYFISHLTIPYCYFDA